MEHSHQNGTIQITSEQESERAVHVMKDLEVLIEKSYVLTVGPNLLEENGGIKMNREEAIKKLEIVLKSQTNIYERAIEKEQHDIRRLLMHEEKARLSQLYEYIKENLK